MYTLYRSSAAFNECLITILIALLCTTATQKKFLYYPLKLLIFFLYTSKVQNLRRRGWVLAKTNATRGGRAVCSKMNKGEQGGQGGGIVGNLEQTYFTNFLTCDNERQLNHWSLRLRLVLQKYHLTCTVQLYKKTYHSEFAKIVKCIFPLLLLTNNTEKAMTTYENKELNAKFQSREQCLEHSTNP